MADCSRAAGVFSVRKGTRPRRTPSIVNREMPREVWVLGQKKEHPRPVRESFCGSGSAQLGRISWQRKPFLSELNTRSGANDAGGVYSNPLFITYCIFVTFRGIVCRVFKEVTGAKENC